VTIPRVSQRARVPFFLNSPRNNQQLKDSGHRKYRPTTFGHASSAPTYPPLAAQGVYKRPISQIRNQLRLLILSSHLKSHRFLTAWPKHKKLGKILPSETYYCGLCGSPKNFTKTDCCENPICGDEDAYQPFSYSAISEESYAVTLCEFRYTEVYGEDNCKHCGSVWVLLDERRI
jgi:hypothetical protein